MKPVESFYQLLCACIFCILLSTVNSVVTTGQPKLENSLTSVAQSSLVYADFENTEGDRPVSKRGGYVQLFGYSESPARPSRFKGASQISPPAPELVRLQKDNPNRAAAFDYGFQPQNQYASVGIEVHGQPDQNGKSVADDVSVYKYVSMQIYATGVPSLRVELQSSGQGVSVKGAPPQASFKIKPGFNTYRIPLNSLAQPSWVDPKVDIKNVLKKLTSVNLVAFCDNCTQVNGTVVVDNIVFEN